MDSLGDWPLWLHGGMFLLILPMVVIEYSALREQTFFWKGFSEGKPEWVVFTVKLLGWVTIIHFVLFLVLSHGASPEIIDSRYVLNDHGQIRKVLAEAEYRSLKGSELRIFVTMWIFMYFELAAYWLFPRLKETTSRRQPDRGSE